MPNPSIKNEDQYQELRQQGMSKEKAARIANADSKKAGSKGGRHAAYEDWTKDELYRRAKEIGIEGRSEMSKDDLIKALRHH